MNVLFTPTTGITTGTTGLAAPAQLLSGTVVPLARSAWNLTSAPAIGYARITVRLRRFSEPQIRKATVSRKATRKSREAARYGIHEMIASIPKLTRENRARHEVVVERIVASGEMEPSSVRLMGTIGTPEKPVTKSYDVDLDEYQF